MNQSTNQAEFIEQENNLKENLDQYLKHWKWFALGVILALIGAYFYLRYSTNVYQSKATILVKDDDRGGGLSEAAILEDLGSGGGFSTQSVEDEIQILSSKSLMAQVVQDLGLDISYLAEGNIKTVELYKSSPLKFQFIDKDSISLDKTLPVLKINPTSSNSYQVSVDDDVNTTEVNFGQVVNLGFGKFVIVPNPNNISDNEKWIDKTYLVRISQTYNEVSRYQSALSIESAGRRSSVINLALQSATPQKGEDILNNLIYQFNKDAIDDKNLISRNTSKFIADRLEIIAAELDSVETSKKEFKRSNRLTDIPTEAQIFLEEDQVVKQRLNELQTQIQLTTSVLNYLQDSSRSSDLLPANLGLQSEGLNSSINQYNQLVLERDRQLQFGTELNPVVQTLNSQIEELRQSILESLQNSLSALRINLNEIRGQRASVNQRIAEVPAQEQTFRDIDRQQQIKESLYLFLLQKREQTSISLAITAPVAKVIDAAYTVRTPISPKRHVIYLAALIAGLLIPFLIIYVKNLLDTKIHNKSDVEKETRDIPILAEVPKIDSNESDLVQTNDRSVLAEAFRIVRTNLNYFISSKNSVDNNVIFVTSTVKGEGKTFVAFNLALTLATPDKKVLVIGADIRNPQLHRYVDEVATSKGLSEFLYDDKVTADSIINNYDINRKSIDMVLSGRIPPNPAELLMNKRIDSLIEQVKEHYDYIIVDTAPTMLVTDTLLFSQLADLTVYVTRAEYTERKLLQFPIELHKEKKLLNMAFVVNNVGIANYGYGNKYGYTYGVEKESWFDRLKQIFKFSRN